MVFGAEPVALVLVEQLLLFLDELVDAAEYLLVVHASSLARGGQWERSARGRASSPRAANERLRASLPFEDERDFEDARRGFIAPLENGGTVLNEHGFLVWDPAPLRLRRRPRPRRPPTVNPSLWRQSQLVLEGGLFKVTDRLYQVRNQDLSNLTHRRGRHRA